MNKVLFFQKIRSTRRIQVYRVIHKLEVTASIVRFQSGIFGLYNSNSNNLRMYGRRMHEGV